MRIGTKNIFRRLFPGAVWEVDDPQGLYLTFDDGPTPGVTEWILAKIGRAHV